MKRGKKHAAFDHTGSTLNSFLEEEGIREEVEAVAVKRVLAWQLERTMREQGRTKKSLAQDLRTSRTQLDRLLDPKNTSVSLATMARAAGALGKSLVVRIEDAGVQGARRRHRPSKRAA
jgi:DNA-binding Xre family transcriptional regulator